MVSDVRERESSWHWRCIHLMQRDVPVLHVAAPLIQSVAVLRRYISEEFAGSALHPIDIYDVSTGRLQQQVPSSNHAVIRQALSTVYHAKTVL